MGALNRSLTHPRLLLTAVCGKKKSGKFMCAWGNVVCCEHRVDVRNRDFKKDVVSVDLVISVKKNMRPTNVDRGSMVQV